jgi:hypothetical protein
LSLFHAIGHAPSLCFEYRTLETNTGCPSFESGPTLPPTWTLPAGINLAKVDRHRRPSEKLFDHTDVRLAAIDVRAAMGQTKRCLSMVSLPPIGFPRATGNFF